MRRLLRRFLPARELLFTALCVTLIVLSLAYLVRDGFRTNVAAQGGTERRINESVQQQIRALVEEKNSRSLAQQKIDSQLLYAMKMRRGVEIAPGIRQLAVSVEVDVEGRTEVDITAIFNDTLTEDLIALGAELTSVYPQYNSLRASVDLDQLEAIAELGEVRFIQPKQEPQYLRHVARARAAGAEVGEELPPGFVGRVSRVRSFLSNALSGFWPFEGNGIQTGSKTSEGDATHRSNTARTTLGPNGSGVRIGVISDGVVSLAASQAAGDTPDDVTVLPGYTGTGDEGTAMLEIIHDVAPGAKLFFATAARGIVGMAQAIRDLRAAGCDIIVDDIIFGSEGPFQDGQAAGVISTTNGGAIWQAVNEVTAAGTLYFSSAGNEGNKSDNTSGTWQGDFVDGGTMALLPGGNVHDFGGGTQFNTITGTGSRAALFWADPAGGSNNDYDLFVLDSVGTAIVASSTNIQNGTQDPFESAIGTTTNNRMVILKKTGAANRFLYLENFRGLLNVSTDGNVRGHANAASAFSVAATPAASPFGPVPNPVGPFPSPFNSTNTVELFSSDGPRRIFFNAAGTPITPGNLSATGGTLRQKPDITAADGVMVTGAGGFPSRFFGTSAAAPHAAAIAGLLKSAAPALTAAQIRTALTSTAIDIEGPGVDRDSGAGIVMAFEALQAVGAAPGPHLQSDTITVAEAGGNGNGFIEPGEGGTLSVELLNTGPLAANGVAATLSTTTPGVSVTTPNSTYPNLVATSGSGVNNSLFAFTLNATASCPLRIDFLLTVSLSGASARLVPFSIETGVPPTTITSTLDALPPLSGPGFTASTGLQSLRLNRNNLYTSCGVGKVCPGTTGTGTRRFDAYTFTNCSTTPACIEAEFFSECSSPLFVAAYLGAFNTSDVCINYLGDSGISPGPLPVNFGFTVPAGATFTIVVSEVNANGGTGCGYSLNLTGLCCQGSVAACPTVTNIAPAVGVAGVNVTINGTNMTGVTGVSFANGLGGAFNIVNSTQITATVPSGAVTGPIILSRPGCADVLTQPFVVGTGTPTSLFVDDSTLETAFRVSGAASENYVNRLTPFGYPATLTGLSLFFTSTAPPLGTPIILLVGNNADGDATIDNTNFVTLQATIQSTGEFVTYNFPATTINSGDFVVGFRVVSISGQFPAAVDRTLPARRRSYFSSNATTFGLIDNLSANVAGNLGIRARMGSAACPTASNINPTSAGFGGQVAITGTNFEGISAVRFANNVNAAFNVVSDTMLTAIVPNGTVNGPIVVNKPNCGNVATTNLTLIQCHNVSGTNVTAGVVGSQVIISGTNLTGVTGVKFSNNVAATFAVNNDTQITATVPNGAVTGAITITRPGCPDAQTGSFTVALAVTSVSAASFTVGPVAPESIVAAFGSNLATSLGLPISNPLPTELVGTTVTVRDATATERLAGLFFVSSGQINYLIPAGTVDGTAVITVRTGTGAVSIGSLQIARTAPGIFTANASGQGVAAAQIFRLKADGSGAFEGVTQIEQGVFVPLQIDFGPATDQLFLVLYGTGIRLRTALTAVNAQIGGLGAASLYAGETSGFSGLDQVNLPLSRTLAGRGVIDVVLTVDGKTANTVTIATK